MDEEKLPSLKSCLRVRFSFSPLFRSDFTQSALVDCDGSFLGSAKMCQRRRIEPKPLRLTAPLVYPLRHHCSTAVAISTLFELTLCAQVKHQQRQRSNFRRPQHRVELYWVRETCIWRKPALSGSPWWQPHTTYDMLQEIKIFTHHSCFPPQWWTQLDHFRCN